MSASLFVVVEKGDEGNAESGPRAWHWDEAVLQMLTEEGELEAAFGPPEDRSSNDRIFLSQKEAAQAACRFAQEVGGQFVVAEVHVKLTGCWVVGDEDSTKASKMSRGMAAVLI